MAGSRRWRDLLPAWLLNERANNLITLSANDAAVPTASHTQETGTSGTESFGGILRHGDPNPKWDNFQESLTLCSEMRRTDAMIRAMLQVLKLPLLRATWEAVPPEDGDAVDKQIADFVDRALFDDDAMQDSWSYTLSHILLMLDYGVSAVELVWRVDDEGYYRLKRLAPRLPPTYRYWWVARDGTLLALTQYAPVITTTPRTVPVPGVTTQAPAYGSYSSYQYITIDANDLGVFTHEREGDNYEGTSILRSVYRNYWYKNQAYHLEGVRLDRWGVGIPTAELAEGHTLTRNDLDKLTEVLKKLRSNEMAFLIVPAGVTIKFLPEGSATGGAASAATTWVDHHDTQIARNVMAGFLTMGTEQHGTLGFGSRLTDLFVSSLRGVANGIASEIKRQIVRKLCDVNFDMTNRQYPSVRARDLDLSDLESLIEVIGKLGGTFLTPDDDTESMLRKIMRLPDLPDASSRTHKPAPAPGEEPGAPGATTVDPKTGQIVAPSTPAAPAAPSTKGKV